MGIGGPPAPDYRTESETEADARPEHTRPPDGPGDELPDGPSLRIVELRVENFMRLKAVRIRPDDSIVSITGRNGAGKSAVLRSIACIIGGKALHPDEPVRRGASKAQVVLDLGGLQVKRTWSSGGGTYLVVTSPNGAEYPSPQRVLDGLYGALTFDPVAFSRMPPAEQVATLKDVAGVGELFEKLDAKRCEAFERRTIVNRDVKALTHQIAGLPEVEAPDEEVRVGGLTAKHGVATRVLRDNDQVRQAAKTLAERIANGHEHLDRLRAEKGAAIAQQVELIQRLETQLADAKTQSGVIAARHDQAITKGRQLFDDLAAESAAAEQAVANLVDPDVDAIAALLGQVEVTNANVRQKQARAAKVSELRTLDDRSTSLTQQIKHFDDRKRTALAESKLPVDGLGFGEDGVTFKGFPFAQASSAEQLRVSVAMGIALNPKLRVMLIHDGSLLDTEGRRVLAEMAEAHDMQVWIESVSDGDGVGVIIEDGEVKEPAA